MWALSIHKAGSSKQPRDVTAWGSIQSDFHSSPSMTAGGGQLDEGLRPLVPSPGSEVRWRELERYALLALQREEKEVAQQGMPSESTAVRSQPEDTGASEVSELVTRIPRTHPLQNGPSPNELFPSLESRARRGGVGHQGIDLGSLSRMAVGFASSGRRDAAVFGAIEQVAETRMTTPTPLSLGKVSGEVKPSTVTASSLPGLSRTSPTKHSMDYEALSDLAHAFAQVCV